MKATMIRNFVIALAVGVLGTLAVSPRQANAQASKATETRNTADTNNPTDGREKNATPPAQGSTNQNQQQDDGCCGGSGSSGQ